MPPQGPTGKEMIFHHPFPLMEAPRSGSQVRPKRMLAAFRSIGYQVTEVTGYSHERIPTMRSLRRDIANGRRFEFCYAECVTSPTALSDPNHLPLHPFADPAFFAHLRRAGIPSAMFYRDVYWRFADHRRSVPAHKRLPAEAFYHYDLAWYSRFVDVLYLPDLAMAAAVPRAGRFSLRALPPGTTISPSSSDPQPVASRQAGSPLSLLYIGSVSPPHYDIAPLLRALSGLPGVALHVNCPESEMAGLRRRHCALLDGVTFTHLHGEEVARLYDTADVACMVFEPNEYRDFAMPVKLFEAIGHGAPCIASSHTAAGRFIAANDVGWAVDDDGDLRDLLRRLGDDPEETATARRLVAQRAPENTWEARARTVESDLCGLR